MVLYTLTLTLACLVAVTVAVGAERAQRRGDSSRAFSLTLLSLAPFCATLSTVAYATAGAANDARMPLVIGDISMPLAVGVFWAGLRRADGKSASWAQIAVGISLLVGVLTLAVSPEAGQTAKLLALALFSALCVLECARGAMPRRARWVIGASTGLFGIYCLVRAASSVEDQTTGVWLGTAPSLVVAAITVAAVTVGVMFLYRGMPGARATTITSSRVFTKSVRAALRPGNSAATPAATAAATPVRVLVVSIADFSLQRAAFGMIWARALEDALQAAVAAVTPPATTFGAIARGAIVALPAPTADDALADVIQEAFARGLSDATPIDIPDLTVQYVELSSLADLAALSRRLRVALRRDPSVHSPALKGA